MHRDLRPARPVVRIRPALRRTGQVRAIGRAARALAPVARRLPVTQPELPASGFAPDPFVDYGRWLTAEGGILFAWKDLDLRLRHTLWRLFAWSLATAGDGWLIVRFGAAHPRWEIVAAIIIMAIINGIIVGKPVELYRTVEIRPDGMILEGAETFWLRHMAGGWPGFQKDQEGNQCLCGIYGTRFVEFLTVRRFDELDRMPEVFAAQLQEAMQQLWTRMP